MTLIELVGFFLYLANMVYASADYEKIHGKLISQSEKAKYFVEVLNASKSLPVSIPY